MSGVCSAAVRVQMTCPDCHSDRQERASLLPNPSGKKSIRDVILESDDGHPHELVDQDGTTLVHARPGRRPLDR
jgi:hypothetical protein